MATWNKYVGTGVCDVCLKPVKDCNSVYEVPNGVFYSSAKYKNKVGELAAAFGMSADLYLERIRAIDTSTYSAVCDQCISLFENDAATPAQNQRQSDAQGHVQEIVDSSTNSQNLKVEDTTASGGFGQLGVQVTYPINPGLGSNEKKTLGRFPMGWVIAMIVVSACAMIVLVPLLTASGSGLALLAIMFNLCGLFGFILMLRKKASGFWLALVAHILLLTLNGVRIGNSILVVNFGLPLTIISLFITMKQIDYRFWKHMKHSPYGGQAGKTAIPPVMPITPTPTMTYAPPFAPQPTPQFSAQPPLYTPPPLTQPPAPQSYTPPSPSPAPPPYAPPLTQPPAPQSYTPPSPSPAPPPYAPPLTQPPAPQFYTPPSPSPSPPPYAPTLIQPPDLQLYTPPPPPPAPPPLTPPPATQFYTPPSPSPSPPLYAPPLTPPPPFDPTSISSFQNKRKVNPYILGGVALFIVILGAVLYLGVFRPGDKSAQSDESAYKPAALIPAVETPTAELPAARLQTEEATEAETPKEKTPPSEPAPGFSADEEKMLAEIENKFPGKIKEAASNSMCSPLLQDAVGNARIADPVFSDYDVAFTVLLPDPASFTKLNIAPYRPLSGAQAYIKENYQNLKNFSDIADTMAFDVNMRYLRADSAEKELDWSFPHESFIIIEYSAIFDPHLDQYMTELGFYTAAQEILMPDFQQWEGHTGAYNNQAFLDTYFHDLAEALSRKGVEYKGNVIVDAAQIEPLLKQRFAKCWAFDGLSVGKDYYLPSIKFNTYNHGILFHEITSVMDAQYRSGAIPRPNSYGSMEQEFQAMLQNQINDSYYILSKSMSAGVDTLSFDFEWEELGNKGLPACPGLVEHIRDYMYLYDIYLGNTALPD